MTRSSAPRTQLIQAAALIAISILALHAAALADLTGTLVAAKPATYEPALTIAPAATSLEQSVFDKINSLRRQHSLDPVSFAGDLLSVARSHSQDQARRNQLSHQSSDGRHAGERLDDARIAWLRYGENVGLIKGYEDPAGTVVDAWLRSPGHAQNLLDPQLSESAVGVAQGADGTYFMTQVFVTR
jgi:uncharacterized protein YkwD